MYDLGARYITITHNCDNIFATAASSVATGGEDKGLSAFGHEYFREMNRLLHGHGCVLGIDLVL
jgi:membrane dipeptidase